MAPYDRFGSPFDPRNRRKVQRETATEARDRLDREQRQYQLRGCGNPNCPECNPETAARGGAMSNSNYNPFTSSSLDAVRSAWNEARSRAESEYISMNPYSGNSVPRQPPKPDTYAVARKAVEAWIIPAPTQSFDDIVGNDEALTTLRDAIEAPVKHAELYAAYNMRMPKGAMLFGPPGCGKTMFARAAASEMKRLYGTATEFISISGSELQSMYVGETEERIKAIFTFAREYKKKHGHPLLVFMDEADVLLPDRTGRIRRVASWEESQVATFLAEMDGIQESGAFVLLATNRPEVIDQAVLRDGRCDFKIEIKRPTQLAVETILRKSFANIPLGTDPLESLVFAALESLYDPHRVIIEAHAIRLILKDEQLDLDTRDKHFLLEHIISGAMAASIPNRAKRYAFARDKADGVIKGVTSTEVVRAVNDLFHENKDLDHSFAFNSFTKEFLGELNDKKGAPDHG